MATVTTTLPSSCTAAAAGDAHELVVPGTSQIDVSGYFSANADEWYNTTIPYNSLCSQETCLWATGDQPNPYIDCDPIAADIGDVVIFRLDAYDTPSYDGVSGWIKIEVVESLPSSGHPGPSGGVMLGGYSL